MESLERGKETSTWHEIKLPRNLWLPNVQFDHCALKERFISDLKKASVTSYKVLPFSCWKPAEPIFRQATSSRKKHWNNPIRRNEVNKAPSSFLPRQQCYKVRTVLASYSDVLMMRHAIFTWRAMRRGFSTVQVNLKFAHNTIWQFYETWTFVREGMVNCTSKRTENWVH